METTADVASETAALDALKTKIIDPTLPILELARAVQTHLREYPQSGEAFAEKIGKSRSWVIQLTGFLKLPPDILAEAERTGAGYRDLQTLQATHRDANTPANTANNETNSANSENLSANMGANSANNQPGGANTPANSATQGYPLIRDTVNAILGLLCFWVKDIQIGQVAERWLIKAR